jgi:hypothetical protein
LPTPSGYGKGPESGKIISDSLERGKKRRGGGKEKYYSLESRKRERIKRERENIKCDPDAP